ncbi:MAG TPA: hypothetical protein VI796_07280 [Candidatus Thermoplasmatota archaeon]|nr:hypothetical protein [Candidatus Thermoplasmatota archaeon]
MQSEKPKGSIVCEPGLHIGCLHARRKSAAQGTKPKAPRPE